MSVPQTRYAKGGDANVAYQVLGNGPIDLVYVWGWLSHLDFQWTEPTVTSFLRRLASFSRLIMFDKRGTGLSDPVAGAPSFDDRMDDIRAVMDAVGSERAALLGFSEGTALSALFAASQPDRTTGLILYDGFAVGSMAEGVPADHMSAEQALGSERRSIGGGGGDDEVDRPDAWRQCGAEALLGDVRARLDEPGHGAFTMGDDPAGRRSTRASEHHRSDSRASPRRLPDPSRRWKADG